MLLHQMTKYSSLLMASQLPASITDAAATIFFTTRFCAATIRERRFFLWTARIHQPRLIRVIRTGDTATTVIDTAQPLISPAVSHGNESQNTSTPNASLVTVARSYSHTCAIINQSIDQNFTSLAKNAKQADETKVGMVYRKGMKMVKFSHCHEAL